jgi:hypothetical protein
LPTSTNDSELHPTVLELTHEPDYVAFTTFLPGSLPQTHMVWMGTDGEHLLINAEVHRQKFHNV